MMWRKGYYWVVLCWRYWNWIVVKVLVVWLSINSCVKKLILRDISHGWAVIDDVLEISAPYLPSLETFGRLGSSCWFVNISSLIDAILNGYSFRFSQDSANDYERIQNIVGGLLASLFHVKNLTLGTWAIEICISEVLFCDWILSVRRNYYCISFPEETSKTYIYGACQ